MDRLKEALLALEKEYARPEFLHTDPVEIVSRYAAKEERELVGLICALFAYGNVKSMRSFLASILPGAPEKPRPYYRFQTRSDVAHALKAVRAVRDTRGTFETYFKGMTDLRSALSRLQRDLLKACPSKTRGLVHLFGDPEAGSARKRYCMFLRWMVRPGFPDFGLYTALDPSQLVVPLDTHMIHMADNLSLSGIRSPSFRAAEALTEAFRRIDRNDPLRFDFALTRPGIAGICRSRFLESCHACGLRAACRIYARQSQKE